MKAIVVLSGGMDSTICLALAVHRIGAENVQAVSFNYGQRHSPELLAARVVAERFGVVQQEVPIPGLRHMPSALTTDRESDPGQPHALNPELPASFVPVRNALFLTLAFGLAIKEGATVVYTGVCETDYSGYPDCREAFVQKLNATLSLGYAAPNIYFETPLMHMDKAQSFRLAELLGVTVLDTVISATMTCYKGSNTSNLWGYGCGVCPACVLRKKGYERFYNDDYGRERPQAVYEGGLS